MKKPMIFLGAIVIFAVIAAVLFFTGATEPTLAGRYQLVNVSGTNSEMFKATVDDTVLEIKEDNTGVLTMLSQTTPVVVNEKDKKISFNNGVDYTSYTLDGKKLTVEHNGYKAVFKK